MKVNPKVLAAVIVLGFQLVDIATTHYGLRHGKKEGNPAAAFLLRTQGEAIAYYTKFSVMVLLCLWKIRNGESLALTAGISAVGGINNLVSLLEDKQNG